MTCTPVFAKMKEIDILEAYCGDVHQRNGISTLGVILNLRLAASL